jgi:hypothetical protein
MPLDRPFKQLHGGIAGEGKEQFLFERATVTPRDNLAARGHESLFERRVWRLVIVPNNANPKRSYCATLIRLDKARRQVHGSGWLTVFSIALGASFPAIGQTFTEGDLQAKSETTLRGR